VRQKLDGIRNFVPQIFGIKELARISQKIEKLVKFTLGKKKFPIFLSKNDKICWAKKNT
jgi:hypothetical protein